MLATIDLTYSILGALFVGALVVAMRPWHERKEWSGAPLELLGFMWFSLGVTALDLGVTALAPELRASCNPYLGSGPVFVYFVGSILAMALCRERINQKRWILIAALGFWAVMSLLRFWARPERPGETDPYFRVSSYQPLWTVGLPLLWMLVLLSPRVKRYCQAPSVPIAG